MKLIIDIPKEKFDLIQLSVISGMGDYLHRIVAQGITLEEECNSCIYYPTETEDD